MSNPTFWNLRLIHRKNLKTEVSVRCNSSRSSRGAVLARGAHEVHVAAVMHGTLPHTPGILFRSHILLRSQSSALSFELSMYPHLFNLLPRIKSFVQCTVQKQLGVRTVMR